MTTTHTLPDGNVITVDGAARHGCVEVRLPLPGGVRVGCHSRLSDWIIPADIN